MTAYTALWHETPVHGCRCPCGLADLAVFQVIPDDGLLEVMAFVDQERSSAVAGIFDLAVKQILFKWVPTSDE